MKLTLTPQWASDDDKNQDTLRFQQALDTLAQQGGGTLEVESGCYKLGGLTLHSNTTLYLHAGAELRVSDDYHHFQQATTLSTAECSNRAFLYAFGAHNITVCGAGKINGNAEGWFTQDADEMGYRQPAKQRPRMIVFEDCTRVQLQDFTIENAPMWTIHLVACQQVKVTGITVDNDLTMANTDALDIDSCQQVHISNSHFSAADDTICLKTSRKPLALQRATRHVVVSNCTLRSKSCAVKIGTETWEDIEDVCVTNCVIYESNRAIGLVSRDGGRLRRMIFSNITFSCEMAHACHWGKADPVYLSVRARDPEIHPGEIEFIQFRGLSGVSDGAINMHSELPGQVRHIVIDGLQLTQRVSASSEQGLYDIRPPCNPFSPTGMGLDNAWCLNPQTQRAFGVEAYPGGLPALYACGVNDLTLRSVEICRPQPLPAGWNKRERVLIDCDGVKQDV
ncbi:glycoside hydrolase family 28 protein [Buttiauxella sp.]|uniref:glycoside hydrolase family 28 protein n=1 Tax=Buttiauxella sp. TaxID=1972222 RepID=UPI003C7899DB